MSRYSRSLAALAALATLSGYAAAQGTPLYGVSVGAYLPTDSEIRDLVGKSFIQFGFSPNVGVQRAKLSVRPELSFLNGSGNGNRFMIIGLPITATLPLGLPGQRDFPYVSAGLGPTYYDYRIFRPSVAQTFDRSGIGTTAHVEAGMVFGESVRLSVRYNMIGARDGFDFSGIQIGLTWQFFRL